MSPADWIGLVNGLMLSALTVRAFWGWVFGREHTEQSLGRQSDANTRRIDTLETELGDLTKTVNRHITDIALLKDRARR